MAISHNYHVGHEGFFAIAPEGAAITPDSVALGIAPTAFQLVGYTDLPEISNDRGAAGVKTVGSPHEVDAFQTQNEYTISSQITLCAASGVANTIIGAACRSTEEANWQYRVLGLPLVCVATGFIEDYADGPETLLGRYALVNSLKISAKEKSPVTADVEIWPLCVDESELAFTTTELGGISLFQEALTWNTLSLTIGDPPESGTAPEYRSVISSVDIDIKNNCVRSGVRPIYDAPSGKLEHPLSLTPYSIKPGVQTSTLQIELHTEIPEELKKRRVGTVVLKASGYHGETKRTLTVTIPDVTFTQGSRQKAQPDDAVSYSASFLARKVTVKWS